MNGVFGSNAPELMKCISDEIDLQKAYVAGEAVRTFYELHEMVPFELERYLRQKAIDDVRLRMKYMSHVNCVLSQCRYNCVSNPL